MKKTRALVWLLLSVFGFLITSGSILFMNVPFFLREKKILAEFSAVFFLGLLIGILCSFLAAGAMRKEMKKQRRIPEWSRKHIGIFSIGATVPGLIADLVFLLSAVALGWLYYVGRRLDYFNYVLIGLILFSFSMHCVLNGRAFYFMIRDNEKNKERKSHEN